MPTVISVEHLSKTSRLGQIGAPSESTRPLAAFGMLREGELRESSRADLEAWWAKMRGAWRPIPCSRLARRITATAMASLARNCGLCARDVFSLEVDRTLLVLRFSQTC